MAVDSRATIEAAASGGVRLVLIDANVGLPRCRLRTGRGPGLAELARLSGLEVRGVTGNGAT
ncbi:MAG: hypothetical protein IPF42_06320 [Candidatus Microthrix sp.]|nr:hypothetical protein [Candidatus Microthrix sp.]